VTRPFVVIGDALLDRDVDGRVGRLSPDAPVPVLDEADALARPGGAALAATLAAADGRPVTLITALAGDEAGEELLALLEERGVEVVDLGLDGTTPEKIRFRTGSRPLLRLDRGEGGAIGSLPAAGRAAIDWAAGVLVADYGRGLCAAEDVRDALGSVIGRLPVVWDPHPRGPEPPPGVDVATPNEAEVGGLARDAQALRADWCAGALCMTRGERGALLIRAGQPALAIAAMPVHGGDPCGAGDRFSATLGLALADGADLESAAGAAVASASEFVAAGGAGALRRPAPADAARDALAVAERVRRAGGTLVATGGCFDLLHAGHLQTLRAARRLGDALVVCLNSDASVRRLKGPERPLVAERDRADLLEALRCVDAVTIFDEDTPEAVLERLRPHVWVKGGDYRGAALPEEATLGRWGGRAVLVPYVEGRSTTRLIEEATRHV
jgi:D-beta-D-heptose 7-phosphate kinase / D-beta-D-heptose 1-phosphate adenosyltransferase